MGRSLFSQIVAQIYCIINTDQSISLSIDLYIYCQKAMKVNVSANILFIYHIKLV